MFTVVQIADTILGVLWTVMRVGGVVMLAPLLGAMYVPRRIRWPWRSCWQ